MNDDNDSSDKDNNLRNSILSELSGILMISSKELHDPKDLAQRIETIKMRYFKLRVVRVGRGRSCLWYRKQRSWGLWMGFDVGNFLEKLIELVGHGCLSGGKTGAGSS